MAATPNINLTLPTVGADTDDWGDIINGDLTAVDALWANIGNVAFGTAATKNVGFFAQSANNLSDLGNASTARTNLGLGNAATASINASGAVGTIPTFTSQNLLGGVSISGNAATATTATTANGVAAGSVGSAGLASGAALANLGYTPANKAGDLFSGTVSFGNDGDFNLRGTGTTLVIQMSAEGGLNYDTSTHRLSVIAGGVTVGFFDSTGYHTLV